MFGLPLHHRETFERIVFARRVAKNTPVIGCDSRIQKDAARGLNVIRK
jgi:PIN domain nuclease of toxin-antitoxin system